MNRRIHVLLRKIPLIVVLLMVMLAGQCLADFDGTVVCVLDGDSLKVSSGGRLVTIRLFGVDCPELKKTRRERTQPYGRAARDYVCREAMGKVVTVSPVDKNGRRLVAKITLPDGRILNRELLARGLAWWYHLYCKDPRWAALETRARVKRLGLWKDPNPVPPWVFRHKASLERQGKL